MAEFFDSVDRQLREHAQAADGVNVKHSDREVKNLLAKRAGALHLGVANYCWFIDPTKALCLKLAGASAMTQPLVGMCDSARCPQATHHAHHRPAWEENVRSTKEFLGALGRGRGTERTRLQAQLVRAQRVVAEIDHANGTGPVAG